MPSQSDPPVAKQVKKEASAALAKRNLERALRTEWIRIDGVQMLKVRNTVRIPVKLPTSVPGRWSVHLNWTYQPVPGTDDFELLNSSFGLNVAGLSKPVASDEINLVRYDVDNERSVPGAAPIGPHINVWQPTPIDDRVHYPIPGAAGPPWSVDEVLSFFLSDGLASDLAGCIE